MRADDRLPGLAQLAVVAGIVGALCGLAGDYFLTYSAAVPGGVPYKWESILALVRSIPADRLAIGHYLGVLGIPLSVLGFWALYRACRPAGRLYSLPLLVVTAYLYYVGTVYHGQLALLGAAAKTVAPADLGASPLLGEMKELMWPGLKVQEVGLVALSLWFPFVVLRRPTHLPKWTALLCPGLVAAAFIGLAKLLPEPGRMFLELTVFHTTTLVILTTLFFVLRREGRRPPAG